MFEQEATCFQNIATAIAPEKREPPTGRSIRRQRRGFRDLIKPIRVEPRNTNERPSSVASNAGGFKALFEHSPSRAMVCTTASVECRWYLAGSGGREPAKSPWKR